MPRCIAPTNLWITRISSNGRNGNDGGCSVLVESTPKFITARYQMPGSKKIQKRGKKTRRWSQHVTDTSDALDLDRGVFALSDPRAIARSLKRSAERSRRRKAEPFRSAMSMLNFYINRAGQKLSQGRRARLERAKEELRRLYHKTAR